jgi:hypothetical protein
MFGNSISLRSVRGALVGMSIALPSAAAIAGDTKPLANPGTDLIQPQKSGKAALAWKAAKIEPPVVDDRFKDLSAEVDGGGIATALLVKLGKDLIKNGPKAPNPLAAAALAAKEIASDTANKYLPALTGLGSLDSKTQGELYDYLTNPPKGAPESFAKRVVEVLKVGQSTELAWAIDHQNFSKDNSYDLGDPTLRDLVKMRNSMGGLYDPSAPERIEIANAQVKERFQVVTGTRFKNAVAATKAREAKKDSIPASGAAISEGKSEQLSARGQNVSSTPSRSLIPEGCSVSLPDGVSIVGGSLANELFRSERGRKSASDPSSCQDFRRPTRPGDPFGELVPESQIPLPSSEIEFRDPVKVRELIRARANAKNNTVPSLGFTGSLFGGKARSRIPAPSTSLPAGITGVLEKKFGKDTANRITQELLKKQRGQSKAEGKDRSSNRDGHGHDHPDRDRTAKGRDSSNGKSEKPDVRIEVHMRLDRWCRPTFNEAEDSHLTSKCTNLYGSESGSRQN